MATTTVKALRWGALRSVARAMGSAARPGGPGVAARLAALPRLARALVRGEYDGTDLRRLALMLGAVGYVVSPVDLVPEALVALAGLGDDAIVISWLAVALVNVTDDFLAWEARRSGDVVTGEVVG